MTIRRIGKYCFQEFGDRYILKKKIPVYDSGKIRSSAKRKQGSKEFGAVKKD
jgi:hypothetical protein